MTSFHFNQRNSILHQVDARIKLPLFLLVQCLTFGPSWFLCLASLLVLVALALLSKSTVLEIVSPMPALWWLFLFTLILRAFPFLPATSAWLNSMLEGIRYCLQIAVMTAYAQILLSTTKISELRSVLLQALFFLPKRIRHGVGLASGLVFGFVPVLFDASAQMREATRNRGLTIKTSIFSWWQVIRLQTSGLLVWSMKHASDTEQALYARYLDILPVETKDTEKALHYQAFNLECKTSISRVSIFAIFAGTVIVAGLVCVRLFLPF